MFMHFFYPKGKRWGYLDWNKESFDLLIERFLCLMWFDSIEKIERYWGVKVANDGLVRG
jgi:hypothetical protein